MKRSIISLLLTAVLFSCSSIPKESNGLSLLVIPVIKDSKDSKAYYVYYKLYYKEIGATDEKKEKYIIVNPNNKSYVVHSINPGLYEFYALEQIYIKSNTIFNRLRISFTFETIANEIKIYENSIRVVFAKREDGNFIQHVDVIMTDDTVYNRVKDQITKIANSKSWVLK